MSNPGDIRRHVLVGTAGHVDHGKTRLVEALTGIDCDRFAEEKRRGITIDIGFAHLEAGEMQLGFVDIPGHERFLHNALAGLGGIRLLLLVVAADEGIEPQTREHLAIAGLLGIPRAVVAITKCDLVEPDLAELAALETAELLAPTPFAGSPVLRVSSLTGEGIEALRDALLAAAEAVAAPPDPEAPARLPLDRAFHLHGRGVVVTGTLVSGSVRPGDQLALLPAGGSARVRTVQVHGVERDRAEAGERVALQLAGPQLAELPRGAVLATPGAFVASRRLVARYRLLPEAAPLTASLPVRFHLFSHEGLGRVRPLSPVPLRPGEVGWVEVRLAKPVVAVRGDRFVLRRPTPAATLGGGEIADPLARPRSQTARLAALAEAGRLRELPAGADGHARWVAAAAIEQLAGRAQQELKAFFGRDRLARGWPRAEAVRRLLPGRAAEHASTYLSWLAARRILVVSGELLTLPGREVSLSGEESDLARRLRERLESAGLQAPSPGELAAELGAKPQILEGVLRYLVSAGQVSRLPGGLLVARAAVDRLVADLAATGWERFSVGQFKDRFGLSRKWAIPLLEHLDSRGVTRRIGDERQLRRS
ncbi:MAG: Selenocysteine-specific elongation factor [Acidobacteria bacterium ADurb.Bin051]|nr:MAG: Selenocysteine-specific elongation factor [Acidobacteria bacterium ADurb.Bin051]